MIGRSPAFRKALAQLDRIAACDATVLIEGESGTGKELVAREIHYEGPRKDDPFVPVNCGALPDSLLENELFGHSRGAYTDARTAHVGLVELADGGTLFLDEVDALSSKGQTTLLRFLQDRGFRRLGGRRERRTDVRVVAACNRDLQELVDDGAFRPDLLYRLRLLHIRMPPLREREGDAGLLARHFLEVASQRIGASEPELAAAPGSLSFRAAKERAIAAFERSYLTRALRKADGNVSAAARLIGTERRHLGRLIKKHGIQI